MSNVCPICCENIEENDVVKTKCGHEFHFSCLLKNMEKNNATGNKCPLCRKELKEEKKREKKMRNEVLRRRINMPMQDVMNNRIERFAYIIQQRNRNRLRFRGRRFNYTDSFRRYELENQRIRQVRNIERKREKITENVKNLSYKEIKEKLKAKGKSSRGYLRTTIEKRLINVLLSE